MFYRPHRDVPCRKAPQVAYIVMFITRWHKKSGGKNSVFCDRMTTKDIDNNQKDNTMKKIIYLALIAVIMGFLPINEQQQIFFDKKNVTSYGYVIVDIEIQ